MGIETTRNLKGGPGLIKTGPGPIIVTLPYPPSFNHYWRSGPRGIYISAEGKQFKGRARATLMPLRLAPIAGPVTVTMDFYRPRKTGDLDNNFKCLLDCLQGAAYLNDSQIVEIHARRFDDKENPRVEVTVKAVETE